MYCGSLISDGSQAGEKETHYMINDSRYTITGIKCVEDSAADTAAHPGVVLLLGFCFLKSRQKGQIRLLNEVSR